MDKINFKDSQTYKNLEKSFEGEAAARVRYGFFSSQAKKDGLVHISNVFAESSDNEKEHAEIWFKLLYGGTVPSTNECLDIAIANEKHE
jgi:rubrerythrin